MFNCKSIQTYSERFPFHHVWIQKIYFHQSVRRLCSQWVVHTKMTRKMNGKGGKNQIFFYDEFSYLSISFQRAHDEHLRKMAYYWYNLLLNGGKKHDNTRLMVKFGFVGTIIIDACLFPLGFCILRCVWFSVCTPIYTWPLSL